MNHCGLNANVYVHISVRPQNHMCPPADRARLLCVCSKIASNCIIIIVINIFPHKPHLQGVLRERAHVARFSFMPLALHGEQTHIKQLHIYTYSYMFCVIIWHVSKCEFLTLTNFLFKQWQYRGDTAPQTAARSTSHHARKSRRNLSIWIFEDTKTGPIHSVYHLCRYLNAFPSTLRYAKSRVPTEFTKLLVI